ncbi:MAG: UDP-2,3-diacylglucosamine diphosphatase [Gammaproteobacteria bacterium]
MHTLFISDVHLSDQATARTYAWLALLNHPLATSADAIYILGDLFDLWLGDDLQSPMIEQAIKALHTLHTQGIAVYIMHGNHDFLLGQDFIRATGCQLLPDPCVISLYGENILLTHGDLLCTEDKTYQRMRYCLRQNWVKRTFLALPKSWRQRIANWIKQRSQQHTQYKTTQMMDIPISAIHQYLQRYETHLLIHGHTHRPGFHWIKTQSSLEHNAQIIWQQRIVLSDWHQAPHVLICYAEGHKKLTRFSSSEHLSTST